MQGDVLFIVFFFQAEDGIRDLVRSRGLGDVYKRQGSGRRCPTFRTPIGEDLDRLTMLAAPVADGWR